MSTVYTFDDTRRILKIGEHTLRRMARSGDINGFRIGKQWRFPEPAIQEFIDNRTELEKRRAAAK